MMRFTEPGVLNEVCAPHGVDPETWISVLAYVSLSYIRTRRLYSACIIAEEMPAKPASEPPPSPQMEMTLMGSSFILPLRINAL